MNSNSPRIGLVLSGGGSIGAYQVGVIKYLAERSIQIQAVSGASIGALNGAILASSRNLINAANNLEVIWQSLSAKHPFKSNRSQKIIDIPDIFLKILQSPLNIGLFSEDSLQSIFDQYLNFQRIDSGLPFYVSVYKSEGSLVDFTKAALATIHIKNTSSSEYLHIQALDKQQKTNAILASASIPMIFKSKKIGNRKYADGGIGDMRNGQGNIPISPLIEKENCSHIIVTHLSDGNLWNRHNFPETTIIEIRPENFIERQGFIKDLIGFNADGINIWINQGYEDTKRCIENLESIFHAFSLSSHAKYIRDESIKKLLENDSKSSK